ncbi:hypothetical protein [Cellulosimicrobium sp. TH-20]|uniref:hypothetical protein n=1 Tax=Cellulosimicrobium sp. TH-20 TaxID=1980001 RepID=UPI0011A1A8E4|nr:hypothetical protein [Cellulosimicrobium sp. TH-20]
MTNDARRSSSRWTTPNQPGKAAPADQLGHHPPPVEHADLPAGRPRLPRWLVGVWAAVAAPAARVLVAEVIELVFKHV